MIGGASIIAEGIWCYRSVAQIFPGSKLIRSGLGSTSEKMTSRSRKGRSCYSPEVAGEERSRTGEQRLKTVEVARSRNLDVENESVLSVCTSATKSLHLAGVMFKDQRPSLRARHAAEQQKKQRTCCGETTAGSISFWLRERRASRAGWGPAYHLSTALIDYVRYF